MSQQTYEINIFEIWLFYFNLFWNSDLYRYGVKDWDSRPKDLYVDGNDE